MAYIFFCGILWVLFFSVAEFLSFLGILAPLAWQKTNFEKFYGGFVTEDRQFFELSKNRKMGQKSAQKFFGQFFWF